jgi:hypothetical protein
MSPRASSAPLVPSSMKRSRSPCTDKCNPSGAVSELAENDLVRRGVRQALEPSGWKVTEAENGRVVVPATQSVSGGLSAAAVAPGRIPMLSARSGPCGASGERHFLDLVFALLLRYAHALGVGQGRTVTTSRPTIWDHRHHTNLVRFASSIPWEICVLLIAQLSARLTRTHKPILIFVPGYTG